MGKRQTSYRYAAFGHEYGVRRRVDDEWAVWTSELIACTTCRVGIAGMLAFVTKGSMCVARYLCRDCGHQFDRIAES